MGGEQDRGQGQGDGGVQRSDEGAQKYLRRLITINGSAGPDPIRIPRSRLYQLYNEGAITWREVQIRAVEWSTDASGRKFYYKCPKCMAPMRHCPDPACAEEGVGHHLLEEDWKGCDEDIPYKTAWKYYEPILHEVGGHKAWCANMNVIEKIKKELNEAIQGVLAKYDTTDYPDGCEFHGELIGLLQQKGHPETATGWYIPVGDGLPKGWSGPLPGKYRWNTEESTEICSPSTPQEGNSPSGGESTAGT